MFFNLLNISKAAGFTFILTSNNTSERIFFLLHYCYKYKASLQNVSGISGCLTKVPMLTHTGTVHMDGEFLFFNHGKDFF